LYDVVSSKVRFRGKIFRVVTDQVKLPDGEVVSRDVVHKFNAVGVVALDDQRRVVLIRQYRHAIGQYLWELPAGLTDVDGEDLTATALRELEEETDLRAGRIEHLLDLHLSPGFTSESIRLFVAEELGDVPEHERYRRTGEEAEITVRRVPLAEAVDMIFKGEITNANTVAGLLAAAHTVSGSS
jgi:8-oxo-dGTP pyrophosphatase MutT (NUDIX family)